jgi:hypothetical protein
MNIICGTQYSEHEISVRWRLIQTGKGNDDHQ